MLIGQMRGGVGYRSGRKDSIRVGRWGEWSGIKDKKVGGIILLRRQLREDVEKK